MISREWSEWTRQLDEDGGVELRAGKNVIVRVDPEGVWLPSRGLHIPWQHLGFADGYEQERLSRSGNGSAPKPSIVRPCQSAWA